MIYPKAGQNYNATVENETRNPIMGQSYGYEYAQQLLEQGTYNNLFGQILEYTLYDRFFMLSTVLSTRLFADPVGAGRTLADTNMDVGGQIPSAINHTAYILRINYYPSIVITGAQELLRHTNFRNSTLEINVAGKSRQGIWALDEIMMNPFPVVNTAAEAGTGTGRGYWVGEKVLNIEVPLASLTSFDVTVIHHTAPDANLDNDMFRVMLVGIRETLQ